MKIALCFPGCHSRGGVERVVQESARYLVTRGHEVHVFANEWDADPTNSIRFHAVPMMRRPEFLRAPSFFRSASRVLKAGEMHREIHGEFDVVNTHGCECPLGFVFRVHSLHRSWLASSRKFRPPLSLSAIKQRINPLHPPLLRLEARHFRGRNYRRVIALTADVKRDLKTYYDVPEADVEVVPNGYSDANFNPGIRESRREEMRGKLGLKPDQTALLFVANELQRKGYPVILRALAQLANPSLRLLVVGRVDSAQVMALAQDAGVANLVQACGPTQDVAGYHAAADLFVLPTQYEAFCLAILEALGSGLPVITTRVPGAHDAIQTGINGTLIDNPLSAEELAAAIASLLNPDLRARMSAAAPASVESFRWPAVMRQYEQVLLQSA
jgi:UDP-glucose:(heptosyl)LPS alpha-1,3-glucosyltransferase